VGLLLCAASAPEASAQPAEPAPPAQPTYDNKLTIAYYHFTSGNSGVDANIRHTFPQSTAWLGAYRESDGFDQVRAGYEYDYHRSGFTLVPSAQAATHGFLGASVYAEAGRPFFAIGGAGRTNLHPYWNLGFDPNDYVQAGAGYRDHDGNTVEVYAIRDNRLRTGQTNTHFYLRRYLSTDWRVTVDVVRERGTGDGQLDVRAWSSSVDLDWRRWFGRIAVDPHVNYTADRQVRIAGGLRF
jgi:hypothetical protein